MFVVCFINIFTVLGAIRKKWTIFILEWYLKIAIRKIKIYSAGGRRFFLALFVLLYNFYLIKSLAIYKLWFSN